MQRLNGITNDCLTVVLFFINVASARPISKTRPSTTDTHGKLPKQERRKNYRVRSKVKVTPGVVLWSHLPGAHSRSLTGSDALP